MQIDFRNTCTRAAASLALALTCAMASHAEVVLEAQSATFEWAPASGPVAGYFVYIVLNDAEERVYSLVSGRTSETIAGEPGDTFLVRVAAFDASGQAGPPSEYSEVVHFLDPSTQPPPGLEDPPPADDPPPGDDPPPADGPPPADDPPPADGPPPVDDPPPADDPPDEVPPASVGASVATDFDGDGVSDLLLRDAATGQTRAWLMDDYQVLGEEDPIGADVPRSWSIAASCDFDGDGVSDLLWENVERSALAPMRIRGMRGDVSGAGSIELSNRRWRPVGCRDFDADGRDDILLRNRSEARIEIWLMAGPQVRETVAVDGDPGAAWYVAGVGDLDRDGTADVVWRNEQTDDLGVWLMDALALRPRAQLLAEPLGSAWELVAVADFDGDGRDDLLVRHEGLGTLGVRLSTRQPPPASGRLSFDAAPLDVQPSRHVRVAGAADFDGDGTTDLLLGHATIGVYEIWALDGASVVGRHPLESPARGWSPALIGRRGAGSR